MLTKNIYLLYPPGYSGSYINWAISKSDADLGKVTVDDPINKTQSKELGGPGTSHLHVRVPTHHHLQNHLIWMIYNRPTEKKIYLLNSGTVYPDIKSPETCIAVISKYDPDAVFIHIHDNNNVDYRKYGALNTLIKWPVYFKANQSLERKYKFDSLNCKDSLNARDVFYKNFDKIFPYSNPLDFDKLRNKFYWFDAWYRVRNEYNPHEVNEQTYVKPSDTPPVVYQTNLVKIASADFINWLDIFLVTSECSDNYNLSHVKNFHQNYIDNQPNMLWFDEIQKFRQTMILTEYLKSHSLLQAFILMEVSNRMDSSYNYENKTLEQIFQENKLVP